LQPASNAFIRDLCSDGANIAAKIAMIAITISISIKVKLTIKDRLRRGVSD
jgi:hypothetical protein